MSTQNLENATSDWPVCKGYTSTSQKQKQSEVCGLFPVDSMRQAVVSERYPVVLGIRHDNLNYKQGL